MIDILEGLVGTSKSSYLTLENANGGKGARMIVRHSTKVDETKFGARSRHIESIFIESEKGERFLFPTKNLAPARAMTQHVNHGGDFGDNVGKKLIIDATRYSNLADCSRHVFRHSGSLSEGALSIRESCRQGMAKLRKTFEKMCRPSGYAAEAKRIDELATQLVEGQGGDVEIPSDQIDEMRKQLNVDGVELSEAVLEAACRAVVEKGMETAEAASTAIEKPIEKPIDEATKPNEKVRVLGREIDLSAWEQLKSGIIELVPSASKKIAADFKHGPTMTKSDELVVKLSHIVPYVRNDTLMCLLGSISDRLPDERNPQIARTMRIIAAHAVDAAGFGIETGLSVHNSVIKEFSEWVNKHDTKNAIVENGDRDIVQLSREDILLPSDNEGDVLKAEVTKPTIFDPTNGKESEPNGGYIERLRGLSGLNPNSQGSVTGSGWGY